MINEKRLEALGLNKEQEEAIGNMLYCRKSLISKKDLDDIWIKDIEVIYKNGNTSSFNILEYTYDKYVLNEALIRFLNGDRFLNGEIKSLVCKDSAVKLHTLSMMINELKVAI